MKSTLKAVSRGLHDQTLPTKYARKRIRPSLLKKVYFWARINKLS